MINLVLIGWTSCEPNKGFCTTLPLPLSSGKDNQNTNCTQCKTAIIVCKVTTVTAILIHSLVPLQSAS